jgi:serine/threonine protein kinase
MRSPTQDPEWLALGDLSMTLVSGGRLGADEVVELLGAGGTGESYRGRDPRLGRDVAVKVLPEEVADDAQRLGLSESEERLRSRR